MSTARPINKFELLSLRDLSISTKTLMMGLNQHHTPEDKKEEEEERIIPKDATLEQEFPFIPAHRLAQFKRIRDLIYGLQKEQRSEHAHVHDSETWRNANREGKEALNNQLRDRDKLRCLIVTGEYLKLEAAITPYFRKSGSYTLPRIRPTIGVTAENVLDKETEQECLAANKIYWELIKDEEAKKAQEAKSTQGAGTSFLGRMLGWGTKQVAPAPTKSEQPLSVDIVERDKNQVGGEGRKSQSPVVSYHLSNKLTGQAMDRTPEEDKEAPTRSPGMKHC